MPVTWVPKPAELVEELLAILYHSGRPVVEIRDDTQEHKVFLALDERAAWAHLAQKYGSSAAPPTRPIRAKVSPLLKVCPRPTPAEEVAAKGRLDTIQSETEVTAAQENTAARLELYRQLNFIPVEGEAAPTPLQTSLVADEETAPADRDQDTAEDRGGGATGLQDDEIDDEIDDGGVQDEDLMEIEAQSIAQNQRGKQPSHPSPRLQAESTTQPGQDEVPALIDVIEHTPPHDAASEDADKPTSYIETSTGNNRRRLRERKKKQEAKSRGSGAGKGGRARPQRSSKAKRTKQLAQKLADNIDEADGGDHDGGNEAESEAESHAESEMSLPTSDEAIDWLSYAIHNHADPAAASTKRSRQVEMIRKAQDVGSVAAMADTQRLLDYWRRNPSALGIGRQSYPTLPSSQASRPFSSAPLLLSSEPIEQAGEMVTVPPYNPVVDVRHYRPEVKAFCRAWTAVDNHEVYDIYRAISRRYSYAALYRAYQAAEPVLATPTRGNSKQASASKALFWAAFPRFRGVDHLPTDPRTKSEYKRFRHVLDWACRWDWIQRELGSDIFVLIPHSRVSNRFIEQNLTRPQLGLWIELVRRFNPIVQRFGAKDQKTIRRLREGGKPPNKRLLLETYDYYQIEICEDRSSLLDEVEEGCQTSTEDGSRPPSRPQPSVAAVDSSNLAWSAIYNPSALGGLDLEADTWTAEFCNVYQDIDN